MQTPSLIGILVDTADQPAEFRTLLRDLTHADLEHAFQAALLLSQANDPHIVESADALSYWVACHLLDRFRANQQS